MIWNLSVNEAMDLVDLWGPDPVLWPKKDKPALDQLLNTSDEFKDYVEDAKWLDDLLNNWTQGDDGAEIDLSDMDSPFSGGDPDPDEDMQFGKGAGSSAPIPEEDEEEDEGEAPVIIEMDADQLQDMDGMFEDMIRNQVKAFDATEFRVFTRDFDAITDITLPDHVSLEHIDQAVAKATGPLQKDLRRLIAARSAAKRLPGKRSGRLHAPNLHRIMSGDDRVFYRREEAETLDTAISLVIDCSGSMNGTRMKLATETAYAIGSVLSKLGVAFECLGFTDNYADPRVRDRNYIAEVRRADAIAKITRAVPIIMPRFKTFEDRWTQPVQRRFAHVFNTDGYSENCGFEMGSTPEGCGMEFAARRLLCRKEKRKIMIVMTDGEPGGHVFNPQTNSDYYAYKRQSVDMVKAIEAAGVDLVGVGIQHDGPTNYYTNSMVISQLEDMPKKLLSLLKKFILG